MNKRKETLTKSLPKGGRLMQVESVKKYIYEAMETYHLEKTTTLKDELSEMDDLLASLEDVLHGIEGEWITQARGKLVKVLTLINNKQDE